MDLHEINDIFDDDDELIDYIRNQRTYTVDERVDHMNKWDDKEFYRRFRFSNESVRFILNEIIEFLDRDRLMYHEVDPLKQLLLTLRFYATGSFYNVQGDFAGIHKTTSGRIIQKVTTALVTLRERYVRMPQTEEEKAEVQAGFLAIANFPRVIGAIDCTHVKISSRGGENAEFYRNRKGYFSLNVQAVCDSKNYIRDIVARWPGSCHDSHIFRNSFLKERFENGEFGPLILIGDSGYALQKFLMTQLPNPVTRPEQMYNQSLISTRTIIERTFGIWKRRFPVLAIGMRCKKTTLIQEIIIATAVLNNIAVSRRELDMFEELPEELDFPNVDEVNVEEHGNEIQLAQRRFINYFQNFL